MSSVRRWGCEMGNYSEDENSVRVDFFKPSGKWGYTEAIRWTQYDSHREDGTIVLIHEAFGQALMDALEMGGRMRHAGYWAVCLEPYHEHAHPLMMRVPGCYGCGLLVCVTPGKCNRELYL
jgi:hypothetical protein